MKITKKLVALVMSVIMSFSVFGCSGSKSGSGDTSDITLVYALAGAWSTLMPYNASDSFCGVTWDQIYDRLFYVSGNCELKSRACESYETNNNVWTFHLNKASKWHDGQAVTADDWIYTLNLLANKDFTGSVRSIASKIEGTDASGIETSSGSLKVSKVDDYTFTMTMKEDIPFESFWLNYNKGLYVLPAHLLKDKPASSVAGDSFWFSPVGSGPCKYESDIAGSELTLASFSDYYLGAPKFGHLVLRVMDQSNFINSLLANEIDLEWIFLGIDDALAIKDNPNVSVLTNTQADFLELMVYNNDSLKDNRWRKALTMAIDRNTLNEGFYAGTGQVFDNWIHPDSSCAPSDASSKYVYKYDPDAAKKLLQESGFDFNYEVKIVCNTASREKQCAMVQQWLANIGVKSSVQHLDSATMWNGMFEGKYDICMMGLMPTTDPWTFEAIYDVNATTYGSYKDAKITQMYAEAKAEKDPAKQKEMLQQLMDYFYEQCPNCNVIWKKSYAGTSTRLTNADVFGANYYNNDTWNWVVK